MVRLSTYGTALVNLLSKRTFKKFCCQRQSNPSSSYPGYGALTMKLRATMVRTRNILNITFHTFCVFFFSMYYVRNVFQILNEFYIFEFSCFIFIKDIHNSWLYCFTNPPELGTRVSLSHRQPNVLVGRRRFTVLNSY